MKEIVLSGSRVYLIGKEDGRFEGRWNGIWNLPLKIADGVNFGIGEKGSIHWMPDFCRKSVYDFDAKRRYEIEDLGIDQLVFVPRIQRGVFWVFDIKNLKNVKRRFDLVVNPITNLMWETKQTGEAWKEKKYFAVYDDSRGMMLVRHHKKPNWMTLFGSDLKPAHIRFDIDRIQYPIENKIPDPSFHCKGSSVLSYEIELDANETKKVEFVLVGGNASLQFLLDEYEYMIKSAENLYKKTNESYYTYLNNTLSIGSNVEKIDDAFRNSKISIELLKHYQRGYGLGFMAGLPHFPIYFGRDIAWTVFGSNCIGDFYTSRSSLALLARFQAKEDGEDSTKVPFYKGEIPHEIRTDGTIYFYSIDATPLFVIALYDYYNWSGDILFLRYLYDNMRRALDWCLNADRDMDGLIEHGPEGFLPDITWMDSYFRGKSGVDVQAIFSDAFRCGSEITEMFGDERSKVYRRRYEELKKLIVERYWDESSGFLYDTIQPNREAKKDITTNAVVPLFFKLLDSEKSDRILSRLESDEFLTKWGIRTRSKRDPEYDGKSYQKGGVWPLNTGWVAYSEFAHGKFEEGVSRILQMAEMQKFSPIYFKEVLSGDEHPKSSEIGYHGGCFIQAWSAAIYLYTIVHGLLGIDPKNRIICPYIPENWKNISFKGLRIGESLLSLKIIKNEGEILMKIKNEGKEIDLNLGVVVPRIIDHLDLTKEIIREKYTKVSTRLRLGKGERKKISLKG
ncbi:MAG: Amylo-alpha-1,6-glucosidase [Candidatus Methanolliviera sp. GoM_oil]|nr:MAG: Amylo-alpha-1,6-glucosidase [Candidatus Methanolliviera sp. GoM_oil]